MVLEQQADQSRQREQNQSSQKNLQICLAVSTIAQNGAATRLAQRSRQRRRQCRQVTEHGRLLHRVRVLRAPQHWCYLLPLPPLPPLLAPVLMALLLRSQARASLQPRAAALRRACRKRGANLIRPCVLAPRIRLCSHQAQIAADGRSARCKLWAQAPKRLWAKRVADSQSTPAQSAHSDMHAQGGKCQP